MLPRTRLWLNSLVLLRLAAIVGGVGLAAALARPAAADYYDMQIDSMTQSPADPVPAGTKMSVDITAENSGTIPAGSPMMTITPPVGVMAPSATTDTGSCNAYDSASNTITCPLGPTLAGTLVGGGKPVNVTVTFTAPTAGTIRTQAAVTDNPQDTYGNGSLYVDTTVVQAADLTISSLTASSPVYAGGRVTYTTTVTNNGPYTAADAFVQFTLPSADFTYQSGGANGWSCSLSGIIVTCTNTTAIASGAAAPALTWTGVTTTTSGTVTIAATVSSDTPDSNGSNNTTTLNTTVTSATDLAMHKSADLNPAIGNTPVHFTLQVANNGPFAASGIVATDTLDQIFTNVSAAGAGWDCSATTGNAVSCSLSSLLVGSATPIVVTATPNDASIPTGGIDKSNTAAVTSTTPEANPANNSSTITVNLQKNGSDLTAGLNRNSLPVPDGTDISTDIWAHNNGPLPASGPIPLTYALTSGETFDAAATALPSGWTCSATTALVTCDYVGPLAVGADTPHITLETVPPAAGGPVVSTACSGATAGFSADTNPGNDCTPQNTIKSTVQEADLLLTKTADMAELASTASTVTYTLTVTNLSATVDATNVVLTDPIPMFAGALNNRPATGVTATPQNGGTCSGTSTITCNLGTVAHGASSVVTIAVARPMTDGTWLNNATAYSQDVGDPNHANNQASASVTIDPVTDIELVSKTVTPATVAEGVNTSYILTVRNNGPSPATGVQLVDTFAVDPTSTGTYTLISVKGTTSSGSATCTSDAATYTATCGLGNMLSGEQQTMTVTIRPDYLASQPGSRTLTNNAHVSTTTPESNPNNNDQSATLTITPAGLDLLVHDTTLMNPIGYDTSANDLLIYKVDVSNGGPSYGTGISFTNTTTAPSGHTATFACDLASASAITANAASPCTGAPAGECTGIAGGATCSVGNLAALATTTRYVVYKVDQAPVATGTTFSNTSTVAGNEHDTNLHNNTAAAQTVVRILADMAVTAKTPSKASVSINEPFSWTITAHNNGPGLAVNVKISDNLPAGMVLTGTPTLLNGTGSCTGVAGGTSTVCSVSTDANTANSDLASGDSVQISVPVEVTNYPAGGSLNNTASVATDSVDNTSADNSFQGSVTVLVSSIAGHVYNDIDNSGSYASNKPGIGATLTLTGTDTFGNAVTATATTDSNGLYKFAGLPPSNVAGYTVTETQPSGYLEGKDSVGTAQGSVSVIDVTSGIVLPASTAATGYDFGELAPATISGLVWLDLNNDGAVGSSETTRVGSVPITLSGSNDLGPIASTTINTLTDGTYSFGNLRPGTYTVTEGALPAATPSWLLGQAAAGTGANINGKVANPSYGSPISAITVGSGNAAINNNFAVLAPVGLSGTVYYDQNADGSLDNGEKGIDGVTVTLTGKDYLGNTVTVPAATTASGGAYSFTGLNPAGSGGYTLTQTTFPAGYFDGTITAGIAGGTVSSHTITAILPLAGQTDSGNNFGELLSNISGYVYNDTKNNGVKAPGVGGISGATVALACNGVAVAGSPKTTDNAGLYSFTDLPSCAGPNGYTLTETQPANTLPGLATVGKGITGTPGSADNTVGDANYGNVISGIVPKGGDFGRDYNFGELAVGSLSGTVYYDKNATGILGAPDVGIDGVAITLTGKDYLGNTVTIPAATTASGGTYSFTNLKPSDANGYTLTETQPTNYFTGTDTPGTSGGAAAVGVISAIKLGSGAASTGNNFAELLSNISGYVYNDTNNTGVMGTGASVISGVSVALACNGVAAAGSPKTTDNTGLYSFTDLPPCAGPSGYTLTETQPANTLPGQATVGTGITGTAGVANNNKSDPNYGNVISGIVPKGGDKAINYNFGELAVASLSGTVYYDKNATGILGAPDVGIDGVTITLTGKDYLGNAVTIPAVTTAGGGAYSFTNLNPSAPGGYTLTETTPPVGYFDGIITPGLAGATSGTAGARTITNITLGSGVSGSGNNFAELKSGIGGFVYDDKTNIGTMVAGDIGIGGATVTLAGCGYTIAPAVTDSFGHYNFSDVPNCPTPGYTLTETQPTGYLPGKASVGTGAASGGAGTADNNPGTPALSPTFGNVISGIVLVSATSATNYNFGEVKPSSIAGTVYYDANADKTQDGTEPGIANAPLTLTGTDYLGHAVAPLQTTTNASGAYTFGSVPPGTYTVALTQTAPYSGSSVQPGSLLGTAGTNQVSNIVLPPETTATAYNFGEVAGSLSGTIYDDVNNNGTPDTGEAGIAGATITLSGCGLNPPLTATSDKNGAYTLAPLALCPAGYTITATQPAGYSAGITKAGSLGGTATTNVIAAIPVTTAANGVNYNFGEHGDVNTAVACAIADPGPQNLLQPFNLQLTVTNGGPGGAPATVLTQTLPVGLALTASPTSVGASCTGTVGGTAVSCNLGYVRKGSTTQITIPVKATAYPTNGTLMTLASLTTSGIEVPTASPTCPVTVTVQQATLSGNVYRDDNNSGTRDPGEVGISPVTVALTGTDAYGNTVSLTTQTLPDGTYSFAGLAPAGTAGYTVSVTQPYGYAIGKDAVGSAGGTLGTNVISGIPLTGGTNGTGYDFGEIGQGLSGKVYVDSNNNGVPDTGETGLAGVTITVTGTSAVGAPVNQTMVTLIDGTYLFAGLPPPNSAGYTVAVTQPIAYAPGKATPGSAGGTVAGTTIKSVVLPAGAISTGYNFGELGAQLCGTVYSDLNNNGLKDANEIGLPSIPLTLTGTDVNGNAVSRSATTSVLTASATSPGQYCFADLPLSNASGYTVSVAQPTGYLAGKATPGTFGGTAGTGTLANIVVTTPGAIGQNYNFGEVDTQAAALSGTVFLDKNSNGSPTAGSGLGGWTVELVRGPLGNNMTVVASTVSASDGTYSFTGLPPGDGYTVVFRNPQTNQIFGYRSGLTLAALTVLPNQNQPVDPSGVIYDAATRLPIAGAVISISGPPGFNPATDLVGGLAVVSQGTDSLGRYKFLLWPSAPAGVYKLSVSAPGGYLSGLSAALPACTATLNVSPQPQLVQVQNSATPPALSVPVANPASCPATSAGVAAGAGTTQFYLTFLLSGASGNIVNNNIPLDKIPTATALVVTKTTPKTDVVIGDLVPYIVTVSNQKAYTQTSIAIVDQIPPGFKYRTGSATLNGKPAEPVISGRLLSWSGPSLAAGQSATIKLLLSVGTGVGQSEFVNQAWAVNTLANLVESNVASATVRVTADPTFDCTDVIGKVFDDRNRNGYPDAGEPGIAGVRLVTVKGEIVTTDAEGRYHIACADIPNGDRGSNYILKLDVRSLPTGFRLTTENPGLVHLTKGKMAKLNFGASIGRVVRIDVRGAAFVAGGVDLDPAWQDKLPAVLDQINEPNAILRVAYGEVAGEDHTLAEQRIARLADRLRAAWTDRGLGELTVETELYQAVKGQ